jgi:hypothetical protein
MLTTAPEPLPTDLRQLTSRRPERPVAFVQGTYYLLIGLWPLFALDSLPAATGEPMQLRAFGGVVAVVGALLLGIARRHETIANTARLGAIVALVIAAADVVLVVNGTAPPLYIADAALQVAFVVWWGRDLVPPDPVVVGGLRPGLT